MKNSIKLVALLLTAGFYSACTQQLPPDTRSRISLEGNWGLQLDTAGTGIAPDWLTKPCTDSLFLPGTTDMGKKGTYNTDMTLTTSLSREYVFEGKALYTKQVRIPEEWDGTSVRLVMERTKPTTIWVDGKEVGANNDISTAQQYDLSSYLSPGTHTVAILVDNGKQAVPEKVYGSSHAYSASTQTNWNGIIGDFYLESAPLCGIDEIQLYPDVAKKVVTARVTLRNPDKGMGKGTLSFYAEAWNTDKQHKTPVQTIEVDWTKPEQEFELALGDKALLWSEFTPSLYRFFVSLKTDQSVDTEQATFGLRDFKTKGRQFTMNGKVTFLRGKHDACVFPLIAHTAMDVETWRHYFQVAKQYGINHYRFHSWCPPEAAFHVADSMGIYLQVECGGWAEVGSGKPQDQWLKEESDRILEEYGNHPSFCMMVYGNEPGGADQAHYLSGLVDHWKKKDPRRVYSSAAGWPYVENADYWNTPDPRIQAWGAGINSIINREAPRTDYDFAGKIRSDMPTVSHEIGQWCVYPNFKEIDKYTGVLKAKNLEIFKETLADKGMEDMGEKFLYASGRLQTLCYKADIEAALRTPGFAGFQLLDLHDFPGQGTALVGVLDPFWDDKGYVTGEEYRTFCNSTVPLARFPKMVWLNNEKLEVPLEIAHFGEKPLPETMIRWTVSTVDKQILKEGSFTREIPLGNCIPAGTVRCDLAGIKEPSQLLVSVQIGDSDMRNRWNIWVYPAVKKTVDNLPYVTTRLDRTAQDKLNKGESVLLLTYGTVPPEKGGDIAVGFSSIFWNTAWTRGQAPHTLGVCCDAKHPALAAFPNEGVSDYQWWDLMNRCDAMILDDYPKDFRPIIHIVDDWFTNRKLGMLYEARVGKGKLLVCGADLQNDLNKRPAAAQFRQSLLEYMASESFNPLQELKIEDVLYTK